MLAEIKGEIAKGLGDAAGTSKKAALATLAPPQGKFGDLSSTLAFALAKEKKANPAQLAAQIAEKMSSQLPPSLSSVKALGPYLNFEFSDWVWAAFAVDFSKEEYGRGEKKRGKVLIEFPSVNPNKPWHVGHLRNALLGDSIARTLTFFGYEVEREDYIDDLGLQVAQSIWGLQNLPPEPSGKFDHMLGKQYVEVAKRLMEPKVEAEVRAIIKELEEGHSQLAKNARATVEKCVAAQYQTAFSYGIYHDVLIFESDIVRTIFAEGIGKLKESGAMRLETEGKNAGCFVVPLEGAKGFEGMENADKILIRSDGTATYTGKDIVFQLWKFGKLSGTFKFVPFLRQPNGQTAHMSSNLGPHMKFGNASRVINVIGMEQAYPQRVLKVILDRLGFKPESENSVHLSYDHVVLPEGRFSGRKGTWMAGNGGSPGYTADELLEEGAFRALEKIKGEWSEEQKEKISHSVALGAIRFSFLRTNAEKKIVFDWEKALSFEGDSGPYLQYAYARACRILEKAGYNEERPAKFEAPDGYVFSQDEKALLSHMAQFPSVVEKCAEGTEVHPLAEYALELAGRFSRFYTNTPVLASDVPEGSRHARLAQVLAFRKVMASSLWLLGIQSVERM